jgi:hypothetical protein
MWDNIQGGFFDHLEQIDEDLKAAGLPALGLNTLPKSEEVQVKENIAEVNGGDVNGAGFVVVNENAEKELL